MTIEINENSTIQFLQSLPLWEHDETLLSAEPAGKSNMNVVLRIKSNKRSVILKQSKPYVRKFPNISAPIDRIEVEFQYYKLLEKHEIKKFSPKVIAYLPGDHLLLTEDLGKGIDFSASYPGAMEVQSEDVANLADYLNLLHELDSSHFPENMAMRILNHEHIFEFPFSEENGFNLDSIQVGLQEASLPYKQDHQLKKAINNLGMRYLGKGQTLLHGDFYPGSWLKIDGLLKVIDPEFGFPGDREFDLGVACAHFDLAQQKPGIQEEFLNQYIHDHNPKLLAAYTGIEILRRLIGIAQLPVILTLGQKKELLEKARTLILE